MPILLHGNGIAWEVVQNPATHLPQAHFGDVEAISSKDAWVVGYWDSGQPTQKLERMHWNGKDCTLHH